MEERWDNSKKTRKEKTTEKKEMVLDLLSLTLILVCLDLIVLFKSGL